MSGAGESNYKWTYGVRLIAKQIDRVFDDGLAHSATFTGHTLSCARMGA